MRILPAHPNEHTTSVETLGAMLHVCLAGRLVRFTASQLHPRHAAIMAGACHRPTTTCGGQTRK